MSVAEQLGVEERRCLLRAARRRLLELHEEMARIQGMPIRYASGPLEETQAEMDCVSRAITWLWRCGRKDEAESSA